MTEIVLAAHAAISFLENHPVIPALRALWFLSKQAYKQIQRYRERRASPHKATLAVELTLPPHCGPVTVTAPGLAFAATMENTSGQPQSMRLHVTRGA